MGTLRHWVLGTQVQVQKGPQNKNAEQKLWNKNWWGLLDIGCWGPQVQVQKGQWNKNAEQKLVGTLGHWVFGTPSASAKRSVEQKCGIKNGRTKILVGTLTDPKCKY